jgi:daunorubicin resistance ABC transporter membrane protein
VTAPSDSYREGQRGDHAAPAFAAAPGATASAPRPSSAPSPHAAGGREPRAAGRAVATLVARDLRRFFRQPSRIVGSVAQTLILWAVLGAGLGSSFQAAGSGGVSYLAYFFPGTIVLTMLFSAIFSTMSVIDDRHHGFLQAVLVAPVSRVSMVLGKTLGGVAIAMVQAIALVLLAPLAGYSLAEVSWPLVLSALLLAAIGFSALGFAVAWWIDSSQGYHAIMSVALIPLWMLSGAMFPASGGGTWVRGLMAANPMTYAVSAVRRGLSGEALAPGLLPTWSSATLELGVAAAFAVVALAAAAALSRRRA